MNSLDIMDYIAFFSDDNPNPNLLGGKGSNLSKLVNIGINVPPGFIVKTNAYVKFLKESDKSKQLEDLFLKPLEPKNIMQDSERIKELIAVNGDLLDSIYRNLDTISTNHDKIQEIIDK